MDTRELENEVLDRPVINPWRQAPSVAQRRYATDLCRTELREAQRREVFAKFSTMSRQEMSQLIGELEAKRNQRGRRAPRSRGWRLAPGRRTVS